MILVLDNYDSFTYNLVHLVAESLQYFRPEESENLLVRRNDKISIDEIRSISPKGILLSPGPGRPASAGICNAVVTELGQHVPILGVCLGHQLIGEKFGGSVTYAPSLMHGKTSVIVHDGQSVFQNVAPDFIATRYHSLVIAPESIPSALEVSATTQDGVIMGVRHRDLPIEGIQFHPESIMTTEGPRIIANWVAQCLGVEKVDFEFLARRSDRLSVSAENLT